MSDDSPSRARYLESLARLQPSWVHESRSHLGNVSLQLDVLGELLQGPAGPADAGRLRQLVERGRGGVTRLERCLERYLGAARPRPAGEPADLATLCAEVGELVGPAARERRVAWSPARPDGSSPAPRDAAAVHEWLLIAAVDAVLGAPPDGAVAMRCEYDGERACLTVVREGAGGARREWTLEFELAGAGT